MNEAIFFKEVFEQGRPIFSIVEASVHWVPCNDLHLIKINKSNVVVQTGKEFGSTDPLIVLFLGDLADLIQQLPHAKLKLRQLVLRCDLRVVVGVLADSQVEVYTLWNTKTRQNIAQNQISSNDENLKSLQVEPDQNVEKMSITRYHVVTLINLKCDIIFHIFLCMCQVFLWINFSSQRTSLM